MMMKVSCTTLTALLAVLALSFDQEVEARLGGDNNKRVLQGDDSETPMLEIVGNDGDFDSFPLTTCQGDCDDDTDCAAGLYCFQRDAFEEVPGCVPSRNTGFNTRGDYCIPIPGSEEDEGDMMMPMTGTDSPSIGVTLGATMMVEGEGEDSMMIPTDVETEDDMEMMGSSSKTETPSVMTSEAGTADMGVAIMKQGDEEPAKPSSSAGAEDDELAELQVPGNNGKPASAFPLQNCQGDCDDDTECGEGLICWMREYGDEVPGCTGGLLSRTDFCVKEKYASDAPPVAPTTPDEEDMDEDEKATATVAPMEDVETEDDDEMVLTSTAVVVESGTEAPSMDSEETGLSMGSPVPEGTISPTGGDDIDVTLSKSSSQ